MRQRVPKTPAAACVLFALAWVGVGWAVSPGDRPVATGPRTLVVAPDGSGQFTSIQEAIDAAGAGDTIRVAAGVYPEDVTIHSKERLKLVGAGRDLVTILGRERVGVFHIGKWPYGATDIEISGLTINEHGGHALGIFNGRRILLRDVRVRGMVFAQQVQEVRIERSEIGGSETTGLQFADSQAALVENLIHDNDHGVTVAGKSEVRLERNVITRNLFEGVVVTDGARATLMSNTIVKNGGGVAILGRARAEVSGNIVGLNRVGLVVAPGGRPVLSFNALYNSEGDYMAEGQPRLPAPALKAESDLRADPRFVDEARDDFRLRADSPLVHLGGFAYLGALAPVGGPP
jgi:parallel beta-helix repeat protein